MQKYFYVIPLLYIVVVLIFFLNFFVESQKTKFSWGDLSIQVTGKNTEEKQTLKRASNLPQTNIAISNIKIILPYASFSFGASHNISPSSIRTTLSSIAPLPSKNGFVLNFTEDTYISFQTNSFNPEEIVIIIKTHAKQKILIPLSHPFGIKSLFSKNTLELIRPNKSIKIIASPQSSFLKKQKRWMLVSQTSNASFHFLNANKEALPTITTIPTLAPTTQKESQLVVNDFIDKAYLGWTQHRFNRATGKWKQPEGFWSFSEHALLSTYAESLQRNTLAQHKIDLEKSMVLHKEMLSWKSAPFSNEGVSLFEQREEDFAAIQFSVMNEVDLSHTNILSSLKIWDTLPLWNNLEVKQTLFSFIKKNSPTTLSSQDTALLLYQEQYAYWEAFSLYIEKNRSILEQNLINNILVFNGGFLLLNSNKNIDVLSSIIAGYYFAHHSSHKNLQKLGYRIIKTALSLADEHGILPQTIIYNKKHASPLGYIAPEIIYPILIKTPYYPHISRTSLKQVFAFSISSVEINQNSNGANDNNLSLVIDSLPSNHNQCVFITHLDKPKSIFAFDTFWTNTIFPNNIVNAVTYTVSSKTLGIKLMSRNKKEIVTLFY